MDLMDNVREKWNEIVQSVVTEAIESLAFMEAELVDEPGESDADSLGVSLLVHDPVQGEFQLVMPYQLIDQIAETVYGPMMEEITDQKKFDLIAEILNTVAGRFLSAILPEDESFKLGVPCQVEDILGMTENSSIVWFFMVEDMSFSMSIVGETLLGLGEQ